jgi:hypothetical protein
LLVFSSLLPILATLASGIEAASVWSELGIGLGLTGAVLIFLQFLSSGRCESVSAQAGIDRTMGFHRLAAILLLLFAVCHPLVYLAPTLYADPTAAWHRLTGMLASNPPQDRRCRVGWTACPRRLRLNPYPIIREVRILADIPQACSNVRFWHLADMNSAT